MKGIITVKTTFFIFLIFQISVTHVKLYELKCPVQSNWKLHAKAMCTSIFKYFCLFNDAKQKYVDGCTGPDWDRKGSKRIFSGHFTRGQCKPSRYQPFIFWTNGSMVDCTYDKSLCREEGQIVYKDDSTKDDRKCSCDYENNFAFIKIPRNKCYCIPKEEDCSCYSKSFPVNFTASSDYECIQNDYQKNTKSIDNTKNYTTLEEKTRVKMDKNNLTISVTSTKLLWTNVPAVTILGCLCFISISFTVCCVFAISWPSWTSDKLESFRRCCLERFIDLVITIDCANQTDFGKDVVTIRPVCAEDKLFARKRDLVESTDAANQTESVKDIAATNPAHVEIVDLVETIDSANQTDSIKDVATTVLKDLVETIDSGNQTEPGIAVATTNFVDIEDFVETIDSANQTEPISAVFTPHRGYVEAELTAEEIYFLRIIHLLFRVACPVVRMIFDIEISPKNLRNTLNRYKPKMEKRYRKKEKLFNDTQWDFLYKDKEKTVTSEEFDIRLMINILRTIANINVSDEYPVKADTNIGALLSKIKYIRNEATRKFEGKLSGNQFKQYWDDIGQAVLNLMISHKFELTTYDKERNRLYNRLLALNPIDIDTKTLCLFIDKSERHASLILQQIISEYCTFQGFTIEDLLITEKHELYHKRIKETKACCKCTKDVSTYFKVLREDQWYSLYEVNTKRDSHSSCLCKSEKGQCSENFAPKKIKTFDLLVAKSLILNIPNLLKYVISRLCGNEFHQLLQNNKHKLYHLMEKEMCCQCTKKTVENAEKFSIDESIWKTLFIKDVKSCPSSSMHKTNCCCQYSARNDIDHLDLDITVLSKLFHVVGPIGVLYKIEQDPFLYFLNWTVDGQPLQKALQELLNVIKDKKFYDRMLPFILSHSDKTETLPKVLIDAKRWLTKNLRHQKALTDQQLQIIVDDNDGLKVKSVYLPKGFILPDKIREFKDITTEENNFLVVIHVQSKIIYPIMKDEFNAQCRQGMLDRIRMKIYGQLRDELQTDVNERPRKTIYLTKKQQRQLFQPDSKERKNLDFKLMINILKHYMPEVNVDQFVDIENIATEIAQSRNGILEQNKFRDINNRMNTALLYFGGNMEDLSRCQRMRNILGKKE